MLKYITLSFFCCFVMIHSQEKLKVNYEVISSSSKIIGRDPSLSADIQAQILTKIEQLNKEPKKYVLYYNNENSYFTKDNSNKKSSYGKQKIEYFKNKSGLYSLSDYIVEEFYGYYPDNNFEIEYKDETLMIENYLCKLAIVKVDNEINKVWYTEKIPVSTGPFIYNNLPGLVLKIERPNFLCYATNISNDCKEQDIKKMNPELKIYKGVELKLKIKEGRAKMINHSKELFEINKKRLQNSN